MKATDQAVAACLNGVEGTRVLVGEADEEWSTVFDDRSHKKFVDILEVRLGDEVL